MLKEDAQRGVARDPASVARFNAEIDANERDLKLYQDQMAELRRMIDMGRAQIGLGDARYQNDALARLGFRDVMAREVQLAGQGQAGGGAQGFARDVTPVLGTMQAEEDRLTTVLQGLETQVAARATQLRAKIDGEAANIAHYQDVLTGYDGEARDLVGHVAEQNFMLVRDKLAGIVLRADVGVTVEAWEVRGEEMSRVRNLQGERSREEQLLNEELREVLDDDSSGGTAKDVQAPGEAPAH